MPSEQLIHIYEMLLVHPGQMYIGAERKDIFVLDPAMDGLFIVAGDFTHVTDVDANEFLQQAIEENKLAFVAVEDMM